MSVVVPIFVLPGPVCLVSARFLRFPRVPRLSSFVSDVCRSIVCLFPYFASGRSAILFREFHRCAFRWFYVVFFEIMVILRTVIFSIFPYLVFIEDLFLFERLSLRFYVTCIFISLSWFVGWGLCGGFCLPFILYCG